MQYLVCRLRAGVASASWAGEERFGNQIARPSVRTKRPQKNLSSLNRNAERKRRVISSVTLGFSS